MQRAVKGEQEEVEMEDLEGSQTAGEVKRGAGKSITAALEYRSEAEGCLVLTLSFHNFWPDYLFFLPICSMCESVTEEEHFVDIQTQLALLCDCQKIVRIFSIGNGGFS
jgi:hypothetical protein